MTGHLKQAWLVLVLSVCFGGALAAVQVAWGPIIERNKENDARGQIGRLVPGAEAGLTPEGVNLSVTDAEGARTYRVYEAWRPGQGGGKQRAGWVVKAKGKGYADDVEVLIGVDAPGETITGLSVLAQNETPGLGNKIKNEAWRSQFAGKAADHPVTVVRKGLPKGPQDIEAIGGATVSSQSVSDIVNRALVDTRPMLREMTEKAKPTAGPTR